jgi:hypothetical protein
MGDTEVDEEDVGEEGEDVEMGDTEVKNDEDNTEPTESQSHSGNGS